MAQKLILPINKCRVTAGYKNTNYRRRFGYTHYGVDFTDKSRKDTRIWGSGVGKVTHAGWSSSGGNVVIIVYKDCELTNGRVTDLAFRYYHLKSIKVRVGQSVTKDSVIGHYGNTGFSAGAHLHLEIDTDTRYPNYTPQISRNSGVLRRGTDSTLDPVTALHIKTTYPDYQSITDSGYNTVKTKDTRYTRY